MSQTMCALGISALLMGCALSLGCPSSLYHSDSKLNDDGSIERVVYQPAVETPETASKPDLWKSVTFAADSEGLKKQNFNGIYSDLPAAEYGKERPYFVGVGTFPSPKSIPDYYVRKAPPKSGLDDARLVRNYERIDHVFVVEHRWSETLTDVVTKKGMTKARDELADLLLSVFADTFEQAYSKEWDGNGLVKWLKEEAKPWWEEMTDYIYLYCLNQKELTAEDALGQGLRLICARHGLELRPFKNDPIEGEDNHGRMAAFASKVLCQHVKHKKDGRLLDTLTALKWIEDISKGRQEPPMPPTAWQKALDEVMDAKHGGKDALTDKTTLLLTRTFGLHYPESFIHARTFEYSLLVPGDVIDTNGEMVERARVKWKFPTKLAYPQGYTMSVRSLSSQAGLQRDLLKGEPLKDLKARLQFVQLMTIAPSELRNALRECRVQKSLTPLEMYQKKARPEEQDWAKMIMDLLSPPTVSPDK